MLYPLKFNHIYKSMPWAGRDFELFRNDLPEGIVGESWDIACHEEGTSIVANGAYAGLSLEDMVRRYGPQLLGTKMNRIPIMLRLVNPRERLSVQVHPTDKYARTCGAAEGKTEAWYVMEAFENAFMYIGAKGCTSQKFLEKVKDGTVEECLHKVQVKKGDFFYIPSGQVHAMGPDLVVLEIGQNANCTYRLFDYGRGRKLDIDDAVEVMDLTIPIKKSRNLTISHDGYQKTILCVSDYFSCDLISIDTSYGAMSYSKAFHTYTCVEGCGIIHYQDGMEYIKNGDSLLIPAALGSYRITGRLKLVKTMVGETQEQVEKIVYQ
ncbi:mannose-6-phosphate isomerase [Christensenellaceae bacterium]|nr:mannose-6-phosphate isomerase [Christensenellaceae bacterium]BDF60188.1 mannose-6-phosphate isomerase [Christensenellaceae bacterium]